MWRRSLPANASYAAYKKALGKPEATIFSGGVLSYRWGSPQGDFVQLTPSPGDDHKNRRDPVLLVGGRCGGQPFARAFFSRYPLNAVERRLDALNTTFYPAYLADAAERHMRFVEYLPAGETLAGWKQMISVYLHNDGRSMEQQLKARWLDSASEGRDTYRKIPLVADESDVVTTQARARDGQLEYTVVRSRKVPEGVIATMYGVRHVADAQHDESAFIAEQEARLDEVIAMLKALPDVWPPALYRRSAIWLTLEGDDRSPVLVDSE